jgi:hypothetical protein
MLNAPIDGQVHSEPAPLKPKERGGCLTAWLIFSLIVYGLLTAFFLFVSIESVIRGQTSHKSLFVGFAVGLLIIKLVCLTGIWRWRRWGVIGYFIVNALFVTLALATESAIDPQSFGGLVEIGIVGAFVYSKWGSFV